MYTQYDDSADVVVHPWTPPFHPTPAAWQPVERTLLTTAQALCERVRAAVASCALRSPGADGESDPCAALGELTAEMRKIDLCLQQLLLAHAPVLVPSTDADFTADLEVDFVPIQNELAQNELTLSETAFSEAA